MADYKTILDSYRKLGNDERVFQELFEKFTKNNAKETESCIAVGPGPGEIEINFLKKIAPQLKHFTCVEKDKSCVAALNENLEKRLSNQVQVNVIQVPAQDWKGPEERVDIVLMFHCLYYFDDLERIEFLRKCLTGWLKPGGRLFVMMIRDVNEGERHLMNEVYREQGGKLLTEAYHIKKDIEVLGYEVNEEHYYSNDKDLKRVDNEFVNFLKYHTEPPLHEDDIRSILNKLEAEGNGGHCSGSLFSVVKTN